MDDTALVRLSQFGTPGLGPACHRDTCLLAGWLKPISLMLTLTLGQGNPFKYFILSFLLSRLSIWRKTATFYFYANDKKMW
jgi:hypothetical protein